MLLIIALCLVFTESLPEWFGWGDPTPISSDDDIMEKIANWAADNPAWSTLALCSLLILPTWSLFRYAPCHTRHTLPEGFFIQVFMASLILLIFILGDISDWFLWLILFYYIVAYRQLFGYSLWGTVWRILVGTLEVIQLLIVVVCLNEIREAILDKIDNSVGILSTLTVLVLLLGAGTVYVAHRINKRPTPATQK